MNQTIDTLQDFKILQSFKLALLKGKIDLPDLVHSGKVSFILKDKKDQIIHTFSIPIEKRLTETNDVIQVKYIGGKYTHIFPKKTMVKEIHVKLGRHLVSIGETNYTYSRKSSMTFLIEPGQTFLRLQ